MSVTRAPVFGRLAFASRTFRLPAPMARSAPRSAARESRYPPIRNIARPIDFAFWLASGPTQCGPYSAAGGQCGHAAAWEDESINAQVADFYRATRATLEGAWIRPRHVGYTSFQHAAAVRLNDGLQTGERAASLRGALNELYRVSRASKAGGQTIKA